MSDRIDIGIDGGGSGSRVIVSTQNREAYAEGGPANVVTDPAAAEGAIRETVLDALGQLSRSLEDLEAARIVAGLAGCRLPGVADTFAIRLPFLAYVVDDSVTALEGAFGGGHGTLVNLGTGSFFIRKDDRGVTHHGGWGFVLGDEGSAAWLGREALRELTLMEDGRMQTHADDPLRDALLEACNGLHPSQFAMQAAPEDFAALAPLIFDQSTAWAHALQRRVQTCVEQGLEDIGHPDGTSWALTGGLGLALAERLSGPITGGLQAPQGSALDGALTMARSLP
ncbi:BadF/BadG/BcrA/BcrD ATPase family protein [Gymnodinialimonas hymeniacidonis]|uniref:BadF/BadG/BcrA/BcrD ATPase family protein n=1 Tax=Gymnodinialimonas hymeniacidonis TaxID=3126508 RepID=UPI0034C6D5AC